MTPFRVNTADEDAIIQSDVAHSFGSLDEGNFSAMRSVRDFLNLSAAPQDLVGFVHGDDDFLTGSTFMRGISITPEGLAHSGQDVVPMARRTAMAINRDWSHLRPGMPYFYSMTDARRRAWSSVFGVTAPVPVFQHHRLKNTEGIIIPLPRHHAFPSRFIPRIEDTVSFRAKAPKVFWRGSLRGTLLSPGRHRKPAAIISSPDLTLGQKHKSLMEFSRYRLAHEGLHADFCDIKLVSATGTLQAEASDGAAESMSDLLGPVEGAKASIESHLNYRYLLALDGNDWPSNLYWIIITNSLMLREESPWEIFGGNHLQPWQHYVPVKSNIEDVFEKFEWCERNQDACEKIVARAKHSWSIIFNPHLHQRRMIEIYQRYTKKIIGN